MATAAELLAEVETAISACLTAQTYSIAGRSKAMAQLAELRKFRQELKDEISTSSNSSGSMVSLLKFEEVA